MPTTTLSATQIGAYIGVGERTALRMIDDGRLPARKVGKGKYIVTTEDMDILKPQTVVEAREELEHLASYLASLEHRLDDLRANFESLERRLYFLESQRVHPAPRTPAHEMPAPALPIDIPPGSIRSHEFAARHGVNGHTFRDQIRKGVRGEKVEVIMRPVANRPHEMEYWLTPEQQEACLDFWRRHGTLAE